MARVSARGIEIDTEALKRGVIDLREKISAEITDMVADELNEILDKLTTESTRRGRGIKNKQAYNNPFLKAKVVVVQGFRYDRTVTVVHEGMRGRNLFDILNDGRDGFSTGENNIRFPVYEGNMTTPGSLEINGNVRIKALKWITTSEVRGFKGRNFYGQIVAKVTKKVLKTTFKDYRGRFFARMKKSEFSIRVKKL